jgi:SAM-dependent methyltransferase
VTATIPIAVVLSIGPQPLSHWRVLDVGCREGKCSKPFAAYGSEIIGIDTDDWEKEFSGPKLTFVRSSIEDYNPGSLFNLVIARQVLPFVRGSWDEKMKKVVSLTRPGGLVFFTVFTSNDGFAGQDGISTIDAAEVRELLERHELKVCYKNHETYRGPRYDGIEKDWDIIAIMARRSGD